MRFELFIASRYFFTKRKAPFITFITVIATAGIAIGVAALIVVLAVMTGFDTELQNKIVGVNAHLIVEQPGGVQDYASVARILAHIKGVVATSPTLSGQAIFKKGTVVFAVGLRGIVPREEEKVTDLKRYTIEGDFALDGNYAAIGSELGRRLLLGRGDHIELISPADGKTYTFTVGAMFETGMYDYDMNLIVAPMASVQKFFNVKSDTIGALQVRLEDPFKAPLVKKEIARALGFPYRCATWMERNKNLFSALQLEKTAMFVILTLIVLVACFNILNTLSVVVINKTKDIAILRALGATQGSIRAIFVAYGVLIGLLGTFLGTSLGVACALLFDRYPIVKLPPDIYYIEKIPVRIVPCDILAIIAAACVISLCATWWPARQAARIAPAEALRYE